MEIFQYEFAKNALIAAVLINIACGIVGTYIVVKKITFISGGISHAAFGGIGIGFYLGVNPVLIAIPFSVAAALSIGYISKKTRVGEDTAIGMIWAIGMAVGIIFINLSPGYAPDLFSYLFGNILTVPRSELFIISGLDLFIIIMAVAFHKEFVAISFDEEYAEVLGVRVRIMYYLLLSMISLSIVVLIRVVGVILVLALLTIPASIVKIFTFDIKKLIFLSVLTGMAITVAGLVLSYFSNIASGATIIIVASAVFFVCYITKKAISRHNFKKYG
jgi:zinc transport system permease protein